MFRMVYADSQGRLFDHPTLGMVARSGLEYADPEEAMTPLPEGATLTMVPGCAPVGVDAQGELVVMDRLPRQGGRGPAYAVGALLPQGYTRTFLPGYAKQSETILPLLGYTAVAFKDGQFWVAAIQTDKPERWNPTNFNDHNLPDLVKQKLSNYPDNRILRQLGNCALEYCCLTAQNIFYERWEGGIPVSPACNANCLGCISKQPAECCPSPQERINFVPTVEEVVQIGLDHLQIAPQGIISFGQGCEGEPSLSAQVIAQAIGEIRRQTTRGTINMNTNAGYTKGIRQVVDAGINSLRVSLISARPSTYNAYYQPDNYKLEDVIASINYAKEYGVYVSLNLLTLPGLTDRPEEAQAILSLIKQTGIDMIQFRNLNIDTDWFLAQLPATVQEEWGIGVLLAEIRKQLPQVEIGNFSRPLV